MCKKINFLKLFFMFDGLKLSNEIVEIAMSATKSKPRAKFTLLTNLVDGNSKNRCTKFNLTRRTQVRCSVLSSVSNPREML